MSNYNINDPSREPWEQAYYETGSTRPPKGRGGIIAVLLVVIIFLGGLVTALGLLNIRLFQETSEDPEGQEPVMFSQSDTRESSQPPESVPAPTTGDTVMNIQNSPPSVENIPQAGGLSLQQIYEKAIGSVVSITADGSTGTGVILSQDGYLVTNCHVVEGAGSISVLLTDGRELSAAIVGTDAISDLAVLYVDAESLTPAEFGDSAALRVGDAVAAIGDPLGTGLRGTLTDGIVSAINRDVVTQGRTMTLIQTNAALNAGNSGGPLLNCYGQVIGINTLKIGSFTNAAGVEGLGFAIPSTTVKEVVDQLLAQGYVSGRPSLGLTCQELTAFDIMYYRLPQGVYISAVEAGSDAQAKGVAPGDILLGLDGTRITSCDGLTQALYGYSAGDTAEATLYRRGTQYTVTLTLGQAK